MKVAGGKSRRSQRALVRPVAEKKPGKLARLVPRDTVIGTLDDLEREQQELNDEMHTAWKNKWAGLMPTKETGPGSL